MGWPQNSLKHNNQWQFPLFCAGLATLVSVQVKPSGMLWQTYRSINDLISDQEKWISELNDTLVKLKKYRDGVIPYNESQIDAVANAQAGLAKAVKNIAESIRDRLDKNQPITVRN